MLGEEDVLLLGGEFDEDEVLDVLLDEDVFLGGVEVIVLASAGEVDTTLLQIVQLVYLERENLLQLLIRQWLFVFISHRIRHLLLQLNQQILPFLSILFSII